MHYYSAWACRKIDWFIYFKSLVWNFLFSPTHHVIGFLEKHFISESEQPRLAPFRFFPWRQLGTCTCLCLFRQHAGSAEVGKSKEAMWICVGTEVSRSGASRGDLQTERAVPCVHTLLAREDGTWHWCWTKKTFLSWYFLLLQADCLYKVSWNFRKVLSLINA